MKIRIFAIIGLFVCLCSCVKEAVHVSSVILDSSALTLEVGQTDKLTATISPANASNQIILWQTADKSVATVASDGKVTAVGPGQTEIRAISDDGGKEDICKVTVAAVYVPVTSFSLEKPSLVMQKGETVTLAATVLPEDATNKDIHWISTVEDIVSVSELGELTALAPGESVVFANTADGGFSARCDVVVEYHARSMAIEPSSLIIEEKTQQLLSVTFDPADALDKNLVWTSSDEEMAIVTGGVVTALKAKKDQFVYISAATSDGSLKADCLVTVTCKVSAVSLSEDTKTLSPGDSFKLVPGVWPERATNQELVWSSSDESVAAVAKDGTVTAGSKAGVALIRAAAKENEQIYAECKVIVLGGFSLNPSTLNMIVGESYSLTAVFDPVEASTDLSWHSENETVATVDKNGRVQAVAAGQAVVCATTASGLHASCLVKTRNRIESITVSPADTTIFKNKKVLMQMVVKPDDAGEVPLVWKSSDENVVSVTSSGLVNAVNKGTASVTVGTEDGAVKAVSNFTVINPVTSLSATPKTKSFFIGDGTFEVTVSANEDASPHSYTASANKQGIVSVEKSASADNVFIVTPLAVGDVSVYFDTMLKDPDNPCQHAACLFDIKAHVSSITIGGIGTGTLAVGSDLQLSATVEPYNASVKGVEWSSSDESIATVNEKGVVTGVQKGEVTITVKSKDTKTGTDEPSVIQTCKLVVMQPVTGISLNKSTLDFTLGDDPVQLVATVAPDDADKNVLWTSDKTEVATVDQDGIVKAVAPGTAKIKVESVSNSSVSAECTVNVAAPIVHVESITLDKTDVSVEVGSKVTLTVTYTPADAIESDKAITWTSSATAIATVSSAGEVTGVSVGDAEITAKTANGKEAKATVHVSVPIVHVTNVTLNKVSATMIAGAALQLSATVTPSTATDKTVLWSSSDDAIATVDQTGRVEAAKTSAGKTCTIYATSKSDPTRSDKCEIKIIESGVAITKVDIGYPNTKNVYYGQTIDLEPIFNPEDATIESTKWSIAQGAPFSISTYYNETDGKTHATIKAVVRSDGAAGGVIVKVTDVFDNTAQKQTNFVVKLNYVASVALPKTAACLSVGDTYQLEAVVTGSVLDPTIPISQPDLTWDSSNKSAVTVSSDGVITAKALGQSTITAKSVENPNMTATCVVTVISTTPGNGGGEGLGYDDWNF